MAFLGIPSIPAVPILVPPILGTKAAAKIEKARRQAEEYRAMAEAEAKKFLDIAEIALGHPSPTYLQNYVYSTALDTLNQAQYAALISPSMIKIQIQQALDRGDDPSTISVKSISTKRLQEQEEILLEQIKLNFEKLKNPPIQATGNTLTIPTLPSIPSIPSIPFIL